MSEPRQDPPAPPAGAADADGTLAPAAAPARPPLHPHPDPSLRGLAEIAAAERAERMRLEEELREQRRRMDGMQAVAGVGSYEWDIVRDRIVWSDEQLRIHGLDPASPPRDFAQFLRRVHPADAGLIQERTAALMRDGGQVEVQYRIVRPDGEVRSLVSRNELVTDAQGRPVRFVGTSQDVTEMRRAEERLHRANEELERRVAERTAELAAANRALREREEHFRMLIENAHDLTAITDAEGTILYGSPSVRRVLGYDPEPLNGQSLWGMVHPDDLPTVREWLRSVATDPDASRRLAYRFRHAQGHWVHLESVARVAPPSGRTARIIYNIRDVTERHDAERKLRETEEYFRALIENSHDSVVVMDVTGVVLYQSPSMERVLGHPADEMVGSSAFDFVHPEDRERVARVYTALAEQPGTLGGVEYRFRHRDGGWRHMEAYGRTLAPHSAARGLVANVRDVTERREAERVLREREERWRALIENAHDITTILDPEGRMGYQSPSLTRVLGYTAEELEGQSAFAYMHPDDAPRVVEQLTHVLMNPGSVGHAEYRFRHRDGTWRYLEAFGRTLSLTRPEQGIVANVRDVTDRRRAEEAITLARAEAERANRAKSEFLSRMSHELRTPMNSILGFAQILAEADLPPADRNAVQHILTAGEHLLSLINEVLDISRIEEGRHALSVEPVRLAPVVREAVSLVRPMASARGVEVRLDEEGLAGGPSVQADRQRLAQVLLNLLSNAVKYNREGGSVQIGCEVIAGAGRAERARVRVEDTGRGVPEHGRDQLFVPFARLGAEQSGVEGTGLGLALSRRLVEAMGGDLALERTSGEGSTFRIDLLLAQDSADVPAAPVPRTRPGAPTAAETVRILYVEDNLANLSLIEAVLAPRAGWRLVPALQGQIGIELAREHAPDLVLLDLHLPDIPGDEVLRRLRADARTASVPVVVVSADATAGSIQRLREAGADAYLPKPLNVVRFLETLDQLLPGAERPT